MGRHHKRYVRGNGGISLRIQKRADKAFEPQPTWCDQCETEHPSQWWHSQDGIDQRTPEGLAELQALWQRNVHEVLDEVRRDVRRREGRRVHNQSAGQVVEHTDRSID